MLQEYLQTAVASFYISLKTECTFQPQSAITEGQFVAWYMEDELVVGSYFLD
jgi:tRNA U34 2-thiouridine synthase MnmA/TrmU